jgi:hypothetical protein
VLLGRRYSLPSRTHSRCSPSILDETIASDSSIVTKTSTMVLSETHASQRGLTLIRVMRGGLWLGECLGRLKAGQKLWPETSLDPASRLHGKPRVSHPHPALVPASERYVACIFSFVASKISPVFHRRRTTATIFRASVSLAISSRTPRPTHLS